MLQCCCDREESHMELNPQIKAFIEEIKLIEGIYNGYELQLDKLCKFLKLKYFVAKFEDNISGSIIKDEETDTYSIYINKEHPRNRQRFTLAHEIGHYISYLKESFSKKELEKKGGLEDKAISYRKSGNHSEAEEEANTIAAELLMPEDKVKELLDMGLTPEEMAQKFFVSPAAMTIRLLKLHPNLMIV